MEIIEQMFETVIKDSLNESIKIKNMQSETIASELYAYSKKTIENVGIGSSEEYTFTELVKFIRLVKRYKPGYVVKDFKNMFDLGSIEYEFNFTDKPEKFETILNFSAQELFDKWFRVYGMRRHRHKDFDANKLYVTNRNECMQLCIEANKKHYGDFDKINFSPLSKIKERNGVEYMKKNFPNIIAILRGDTDIGIPIEDYPVTNMDDPLYEF